MGFNLLVGSLPIDGKQNLTSHDVLFRFERYWIFLAVRLILLSSGGSRVVRDVAF